MSNQFVNEWLQKLKNYWINKDIDSVMSLFEKTTFYQETPFMEAYTTIEEIKEDWQGIKDTVIQDIIFNVLAIENNTVIVNWDLKQNDNEYNGIYEIKFDKELNCISFRSWEMANEE